MMRGMSYLFLGTVLVIPVIGQINPETAVDKLAVGTAQMVLAMVAVVEFLALAFFFRLWRKDVASDKADLKANAETLSKLLAQNSVALSDNAQASHRTSKALDGLERSVSGFSDAVNRSTEVIRKCER